MPNEFDEARKLRDLKRKFLLEQWLEQRQQHGCGSLHCGSLHYPFHLIIEDHERDDYARVALPEGYDGK